MIRFFLAVIFLFFIAISFSQNKPRYFHGEYVSGVDSVYFRIESKAAVSDMYSTLFTFTYWINTKKVKDRSETFYGQQVDSIFYLAKDSTNFNLRKYQLYFDTNENLIINDVSILYYKSNLNTILAEYIPHFVDIPVDPIDGGDGGEFLEQENSEEIIYDFPEELPDFPGGMGQLRPYFNGKMLYPTYEKEQGIQGTVYVQFVVEKDGSITHAIVLKGESQGLDKEALRLIKSMPKWIPAKQNGNIVRSRFTVPITFRLE